MGYANRRKIRLNPRDITLMVDLPEGIEVVAAYASSDPVGINLVLVNADFSPVPPEAEAPYLTGYVDVREGGGIRLSYTDEVT